MLISALLNAGESTPTRTFSHPDRIRYDRQCLTIDGKDVFIFSGGFHYFRCPKPLWRDRFQRIKEAGFNCVETYAAWNWHEREMPAGPDDFSKVDLKDFEDWLAMAEEFGFYIIVRPGPYICAEWAGGGFPHWLLTKKPAGPQPGETWLRSDDAVFLAWAKHWYDAVCPVIAKHQITRKPAGSRGVILVQLENEYDFPRLTDDVKRNQVKSLAHYAQANGIAVPLFTCWTQCIRERDDPVLQQVFDSCNFYPRWEVDGVANDIAKLRRQQSDAPLMTTELQGGWFSKVGDKLSEEQDGITAAQINNLTLFAIQNGETLLNYYMLFGGSNPGDWGARDLTATYDYNAPIREWGGVGERYQRVRALGQMLREHGTKLARAEVVECEVTVAQKDVSVVLRRASDGSRYFFVRTSQHTEPRKGAARVKAKSGAAPAIIFDYDLEPFGSAVFYLPPGGNGASEGEWLPKAAPPIERPAQLPASVTITSARQQNDPGPARWTKIESQHNLAELGIYDSGFLFYQVNAGQTRGANLVVEHPVGDTVLVTRGGAVAKKTGGIIGSGGMPSRSFYALPDGAGPVQLLYENLGHPHGGAGIEQHAGIFSARLTTQPLGEEQPIAGWRMHEVSGVTKRPEVKKDFNDDDWTPVTVEKSGDNYLAVNQSAVYRARLVLTADELKRGATILKFGQVDDVGWIYVNGKKVGQTTDWSRAYAFDVTRQLHAGTNLIAVVVRNESGGGGLSGVTRLHEPDGIALALERVGRSAGEDGRWCESNFKDTKWQMVAIGARAADSNQAVLSWYRMHFALPARKKDVWVPWRLRLHATGNGFLYLNGHSIGRYWEAGPQRDYFLPECWLNFGPDQSNVLTLNLRPTDKDAAIQSASVEPYAEFAEKRQDVPRLSRSETAARSNVQ